MRNTETKKQALSSMAYFFLRMAFAKEKYPESVKEELQWVVDNLLSADPDEDLLEAVREEFIEGDYLHTPESFPAAAFPYATFQEMLMENYVYVFDETQPLVETLSAMRYYAGRPLIVLIKRSGVNDADIARYLHDKYNWQLAQICTTNPDFDGKPNFRLLEEAAMNAIPEEETMAYTECEDGYHDCVTRYQLGMADLYVGDCMSYWMLEKRYHDRPMYVIMIDAPDDILTKHAMECGATKEEATICIAHDQAMLRGVSADATIQMEEMSTEDIGETIALLAKEVINAHAEPKHAYLNLYIHDIQWDTSDGDYDPDEDDEPDLPEALTVSDRFRVEDYKNKDGSMDEYALSEDVSDWLSDEYGFCHGGFQMEIIG